MISPHFIRILGRTFPILPICGADEIWNGKSVKCPRHATVEKLPHIGLGALGGEDAARGRAI